MHALLVGDVLGSPVNPSVFHKKAEWEKKVIQAPPPGGPLHWWKFDVDPSSNLIPKQYIMWG